MSELAAITGLDDLWQRTRGTSDVSVAVLDGLVDTDHPCFQGAELTRLPTLIQGKASATGEMSAHGTHIASLIFGQPGSPVEGIAPGCRGIIAPVFADDRRLLSQLDLARAIEQAADKGAQVINVSSGSLTDFGEAEDWLARAVKMCRDRNILIVAAAGNDGCDCLHVPAALPAVLAVGAQDATGKPLDFSNWGEAYQSQGILAPGENILGAQPGGGTMGLSGTSFAAPIVAGVAALLLSWQAQRGEDPNPQAVREALLASALPCEYAGSENGRKCLAGILNVPGAVERLTGERMSESLENAMVEASGCSCDGTPKAEPAELKVTSETETAEVVAAAVPANPTSVNPVSSQGATVPENNMTTSNAVTPSQQEEPAGGIVYAIGTLGYDFGTEARRDSFKQLMLAMAIPGRQIPANPCDREGRPGSFEQLGRRDRRGSGASKPLRCSSNGRLFRGKPLRSQVFNLDIEPGTDSRLRH